MKNIKVVIGSGFGDEAKGVMTDYFSSTVKNGIVVRFNGSAQAGHTVTTPEGKRHVFSHIGSGSFNYLPTFLSSYFVVNPLLFNKEIKELREINLVPKVYVDENCYVTTPYDVMLNQIAEIVRGSKKHGSCGVGFNETIERALCADQFKLTMADLNNERLMRDKVSYIRENYVKIRLKQLGIDKIPERYENLLVIDEIIESYICDVENMLDFVVVTNSNILNQFEAIVFEGAQGLLLDQNHKYFPHVTRSNTGMKNVAEIISKAGFQDRNIEIVYVTRAYMTRHGAGPFPTELESKPYSKIVDLTNLPNPFQDTLRFGLLDLDNLAATIHKDMENAKDLNSEIKLAISCLDQIDKGEVDYFIEGEKKKSPVDIFIKDAFQAIGVHGGYLSYGVTRDTVIKV